MQPTQIKTLAQDCAKEIHAHARNQFDIELASQLIELTLTKALEGMVTREEYERQRHDRLVELSNLLDIHNELKYSLTQTLAVLKKLRHPGNCSITGLDYTCTCGLTNEIFRLTKMVEAK